MFVFVRQDIPLQHQTVQSAHAVLTMAQYFRVDGTPNIILIGVPDQAGLKKVEAKLDRERVAYHSWHEPDYGFGFTAIATEPMTKERKEFLKDYRLYAPVVQSAERPALIRYVAGSSPAGSTNGPRTEASVLVES